MEPYSGRSVTITIAESGTASNIVTDLAGWQLLGVMMPAAWTAADLGFKFGLDGTTLYQVVKDGDPVAETVAASQYISLAHLGLICPYALQVLSLDAGDGTAEAQVAARTLTLFYGA
jgi:hypothetical protein